MALRSHTAARNADFACLKGILKNSNNFYPLPIAKDKLRPVTALEGAHREQMYSYIFSLTSTLNGAGDQNHVPAALSPRKTTGTQLLEAGRVQGQCGRI
jgi:hypothetical protein